MQEDGTNEFEQKVRAGEIVSKLELATEGKLRFFVDEHSPHDVRPIVRAPHLLELRWHLRGSALRLYFDEPRDQPGVMRGLHAHVKTTLDDQDGQIEMAEKVRVEGTEFR